SFGFDILRMPYWRPTSVCQRCVEELVETHRIRILEVLSTPAA
ncbi:22079_t:CDS:2, partial [Dentiscutata erythropus]